MKELDSKFPYSSIFFLLWLSYINSIAPFSKWYCLPFSVFVPKLLDYLYKGQVKKELLMNFCLQWKFYTRVIAQLLPWKGEEMMLCALQNGFWRVSLRRLEVWISRLLLAIGALLKHYEYICLKRWFVYMLLKSAHNGKITVSSLITNSSEPSSSHRSRFRNINYSLKGEL